MEHISSNWDQYEIFLRFLIINDSINTIRISDDSLLYTKIGIKNSLGDFKLFSAKGNLSQVLKDSIPIRQIMKNNNIVHIRIIKNNVIFSYRYAESPCYKMLYSLDSLKASLLTKKSSNL